MADLVVTATNVLASVDASLRTGVAGAVITAGQVVYRDTANNNVLKLADANSASAVARTPVGIACNGGAIGQPITYMQTDPNFQPGYTVAAGDIVILASDNPGASALAVDAVSGDYITVLGIGVGTNKINCPGFTMSSPTAK